MKASKNVEATFKELNSGITNHEQSNQVNSVIQTRRTEPGNQISHTD